MHVETQGCWGADGRTVGRRAGRRPRRTSVELFGGVVSGPVAGEAQAEQGKRSCGHQPVPVRLKERQVAGRSERELQVLTETWLAHTGDACGSRSGMARFAASSPRGKAHCGLLKGVVDTGPGGGSQITAAGA